MDTIIRQGIGIDIAKASFTACICKRLENGTISLSNSTKFDNNPTGFNQLIKWTRKHCLPSVCSVFGMEATGSYYEPLAYHLSNLHQQVNVILPNKVKHYAKSLNIKSKNDNIDASIIAQLVAERDLHNWTPPQPIFKELRSLTRLCADLKVQRTAMVNKNKAYQTGFNPLNTVSNSIKAIIAAIDKEILVCKRQIEELIASDDWLHKKVNDLLTIKGLGMTTVAIIIGETEGFRQVVNSRQLTSYAGYDIVQNESGVSIKGKTRISKKGNNRIRAALHFPSLSASLYNKELHDIFNRINKNKPSKMIGVVALQRKMLILAYTLWKNNTVYMPLEQRNN